MRARLAVAVDKRSNGRLKIELYPNSSLASSADSVAGLNSGTVDLTTQDLPILQPLFPQLQALTLPFIFKNLDSMLRVVDGPIGNELFEEFSAKGHTRFRLELFRVSASSRP